MGKRGNRLTLVLFAVLVAILLSAIVSATCCLKPGDNYCQDVTEAVCGAALDQYDCGSVESECTDKGCCIGTCISNTERADCDPDDFYKSQSCEEFTECQKGCCIQIDNTDSPYLCDDGADHKGIYEKDCVKDISSKDKIFYEGEFGNSCTDICLLNKLPSRGRIYGHVYYPTSNNAVNAIVMLDQDIAEWVYNLPAGYEFTEKSFATYTLTAYYTGYKPVSQEVVLNQDEIQVDIYLTEPTTKGYLTGKVKDSTTGLPIQNALVSYTSNQDSTDSAGIFILEDINSGTVIFTASADGYESKSKPINIVAGELAITDFKLTPSVASVCGNSLIEGTEECDDGNILDGDGCSSDCKIEPGYEKGWLNGYTSDQITEYLLNDVLVNVLKDSTIVAADTSKTQLTIPPKDGFYQIFDMLPGTYTVEASKQGYYTETIEDVEIELNKGTNLNIELMPLPEECLDDLPEPGLELYHVKGKANIILKWSQLCMQEFDVTAFKLYRDDNLIKSSNKDTFEYEDTGLEWDTEYTYKLVSVTSSGDESYTIRVIMTGNQLCEDRNEEEFCINSGGTMQPPLDMRAKCNNNNRISEIQSCITAEGTQGVCRQKNDFTYCVYPDDCESLGIDYYQAFIPNILGMYYYDTYNSLKCLEDEEGDPRFCYTDYYKEQGPHTTVDRCLSCKTDGNCFDYQSEKACEQDNCEYNDCEWYGDYEYVEFGKSFCYQEDYAKTDKCYLCSDLNSIFKNSLCTPEVCSNLGKCFSDDGICEECTDEIRCESYKDKFSCEGSNPFNIPGTCASSEEFEYSDDACQIGRCKWINNKCVKDADDNDLADCDSTDMACQIDTSPPTTTITSKPEYINSEGNTIEFSSDGKITYYCIDNKDCCPDKEIINNAVLLPNDDFTLTDVEGEYNISFYSVDEYDNVEQIKKEIIYVDTNSPEITLAATVSYNDDDSDLSITVSLDEQAYCEDELKRGYDQSIGSEIKGTVKNDIVATFTSLDDGFYLYSIECKDEYNNKAKKEEWIVVDRVKGITVVSPENAAVIKNKAIISLKTTTQNYCRYKDHNQNWNYIGPNHGQGIFDSQTGDFKYILTLPDLPSATYDYAVECHTNANMDNLYDTTNLVFTIDESPPLTTALYEKYTGIFEPLENKAYKNPKLKFSCEDYPETSFGCKETKYCYDTSQCIPDTVYTEDTTFTITNTEPVYLCFYSSDNGDNIEATKCKHIIIDSQPPELSITIDTPYGNQYLPKITYGEDWIVTVKSNEQLYNISKMEFIANTKLHTSLLSRYQVSSDRMEWKFKLNIPSRSDLANLEGNNSAFVIEAEDLSQNIASSEQIKQGRHFEIDTKGPNPVTLVPEIPSNYYTKESSIFIIGFTNPAQGNSQVVMNISDTEFTTLSSPTSILIDTGTAYDPDSQVDKGKTTISLWDDKTTTFTADRYIEFTHKRTNLKRYKITSSYYDSASAITVLQFTPALEEEVSGDESVYVFDEELPTGVFSFNPSLNYGDNVMYIYSVDEVNNPGIKTKRTITFDSQPFEILYYSPHNGTITSDENTNISAIILDEFSGIDSSTINLTINDISYYYDDLLHNIENGKLFLTYRPSSAWEEGNYFVSLSGEDSIGNYNYLEWEFEINKQVPLEPEFRIKGGNYYSPYNMWYTSNTTPEAEIEFVDEVYFTNSKLLTSTDIDSDCTQINETHIKCTFSSPLPEKKHKLEFMAKAYTDGAQGRWIKEFIVDNTPPVLDFTTPLIVNKREFELEGTYNDISMDLDDRITIKGAVDAETEATLSDNKFTASINLNDSEEIDYSITAEAYDKAGNYGYKTADITLDYTSGAISIIEVSSTDGTGSIIFYDDVYKTDISKNNGIRIKGTTDEDSILDIYQNGYKLTDISPVYSDNNEFSFTLTLVNGLNNISISGTDIAGNELDTEPSVLIELDQAGPIITITIG